MKNTRKTKKVVTLSASQRINRVEVVIYSERDKMKCKEWYLVLLLLAVLLLLCGLTGRAIGTVLRPF